MKNGKNNNNHNRGRSHFINPKGFKGERIRKEIHLPKELSRDLKIIAAMFDKSVKKYMEDLIILDLVFKSKNLIKGKVD